jgi:hypothetical protein
MNKVRLAMALAPALALLLVDSQFIMVVLGSGILASSKGLALVVFAIQIPKTVLALTWRRLREAGASIYIDLYGAELFLLPVLAGVGVATGSGELTSLSGQLLQGWVVGVAFAGLPFAAYRIGRSILRAGSLDSLLPLGVVASEGSLLFVNAAYFAASAHGGLADVANAAFLGRAVTVPGGQADLGAVWVVYISLLVYALIGAETEISVNKVKAMLLAVLATGAGLGLAVSSYYIPSVGVLTFAPPTFAIVAFSWWYGRAR